MAVDEALLRGLDSSSSGGGGEGRQLPLLLYYSCHAKMRVALELAFQGCMGEAASIMRDSIESAAHAHRLHTHPDLQRLWVRKTENLKEWDRQFWHVKKDKLFSGLD